MLWFFSSLALLAPGILALSVEPINVMSKTELNCAFDQGSAHIHGHRISNGRLFGVCTGSSTHALELIPERIVVPPARYAVTVGSDLVSVDATTDGLYQLYLPGGATRQFVVWTRRNGTEALLRNVAGLYAHGTGDDLLGIDELISAAKTRLLSITCGNAVRLAKELLIQQGIRAREVFTITHERRNGIDDGHILLEVISQNRWVLYDPDLKIRFTAGSRPLDLVDVRAQSSLRLGTNFRFYAQEFAGRISYTDLRDANGADFTFIEIRTQFSPATIERWYQRVLGSVGRYSGSEVIFWEPAQARRGQILQIYPVARFVSKDNFRLL
jgi:hypothetical protein